VNNTLASSNFEKSNSIFGVVKMLHQNTSLTVSAHYSYSEYRTFTLDFFPSQALWMTLVVYPNLMLARKK